MNNNDKLVDYLMTNLDSLQESIDWKKNIHTQNYDYKTFEDGKYGRVDYPDTVYDYGTFYIGNTKFSVTFTRNSYNNKQFNNTYNITSIHPYDNSKYHYAIANKDDNEYKIYLGGELIQSIPVSSVSDDKQIESVAEKLLELDKNINPEMSYN